MKNCILVNNELVNMDNYYFPEIPERIVIYEVIRIINQKPLFLEDHLERFFRSILLKNLKVDLSFDEIKSNLQSVIKVNNLSEGNLRFLFTFSENDTLKWDFIVHQVPHYYCTAQEYENGITAILITAERKDPNAKIQNLSLQDRVKTELLRENAYEALLVNSQGWLTEGSKSNLFLIKNDTLYTCPQSLVLPGITRKKVNQLANKLQIELIEEAMSADKLSSIDALFIAGTSPKILPIRFIGELKFNVNHPTSKNISFFPCHGKEEGTFSRGLQNDIHKSSRGIGGHRSNPHETHTNRCRRLACDRSAGQSFLFR